VVLNTGKLVAPERSVFIKLAPEISAPDKSTFLKFVFASDILVRFVPTNDMPVKFLPARLVVTVCPLRFAAAPMVIVNVVFVGALYCALDACAAVIVTEPVSSSVTSPVVRPTVALAVLLLVYVIAPLLALLATTVNASSVRIFVVGGLTNANVVVPFETVSVLLVTGVGALYCGDSAWDAVNVAVPAATKVIMPLLALIVATPVALLEYVIAPLLSLVGTVMLNGASPNVFDSATDNDDRDVVPRETVSVLLVTGVGDSYCADSAWDAVNVTVPAATKVMMPLLGLIVATPVALLEYVIAPLLSLVGAVMLNGASPNVFDPATENDVRDVVPNATVSVLLFLTEDAYWGVESCVAMKYTVPPPTRFIKFPEVSMVATAGLLLLYVIAPSLLMLVGAVVMLNDASPNVLLESTRNVDPEKSEAAGATVSVLLVTGVGALYCAEAA
jgi:hypothetical protein